jgi:hypothetical protein
VDKGFTVTQVVGRVLVVNLALVALAAATVWWNTPVVEAGGLVAGIALVGLLLSRFSKGPA